MSSLSSKLKRVFLNKANLSDEVYKEELEYNLDEFIKDKENTGVDCILAVCDTDGKFGLLLLDDDDEVHSNLACLKELKEIWGSGYRKYIEEIIPDIVEDLEKGYVYRTGFEVEFDDDDDDYDENLIMGILKDVIIKLKKEATPVVTDQNISMVLENELTPKLIVALASYPNDKENNNQEEILNALVEILIPCLDEIRMSAENGIADAKEDLNICLEVVKQMLENTRSQEFGAIMLKILGEAKIKPTDDITEIIEEVFSEADFSPEEAYSSFTAMIEHHNCPFELIETVFSSAGQIGEEAKTNIISLLLQHENQIAKDAACLIVLDENPNIRSS